jgi:hypothetical protein
MYFLHVKRSEEIAAGGVLMSESREILRDVTGTSGGALVAS